MMREPETKVNKETIISTLTSLAVAVMTVASMALAVSVNAALIGPWPMNSTNQWEDQPITGYTGGAMSISSSPGDGLLNMPVATGAPKNATWLPYASYTGERLVTAQLSLAPGTALNTIHVRVYDPATTGKHGWAVIFKDGAGKILDFGIRPVFASAQIIPHQYDGTTWTTSPTISRVRTGNNYYSLDFVRQSDGAWAWTIAGNESNTNFWTNNGITAVQYGDISALYLNVMTADTTGAGITYKWTEFNYTTAGRPSLPALSIIRSNAFVSLAWPSSATGFLLQETETVTAGWTNVVQSPSDDGTNQSILLPLLSGNRFFRLSR
jgi:hypothetical protein